MAEKLAEVAAVLMQWGTTSIWKATAYAYTQFESGRIERSKNAPSYVICTDVYAQLKMVPSKVPLLLHMYYNNVIISQQCCR